MKRLVLLVVFALVVSLFASSVVAAESSNFCVQKMREAEGERLFEAYLTKSGRRSISQDNYETLLLTLVSSEGFNRNVIENALIEEYAQWYFMQKWIETVERPVPTVPTVSEWSDALEPSVHEADLLLQSAYNPANAVWYAYEDTIPGQEVESPNYQRMVYDCTNFVSQCLEYDGLPMVDDPLRPKFSVLDWYYAFNGSGKSDDDWSWTWSRASYLFQYLSLGGVADRVFFDYQLRPGDIVSFDRDGDSAMDHTTIVTRIGADGTVYLTYHSTDKEDEPIKNLRDAGYTAFAWRIR